MGRYGNDPVHTVESVRQIIDVSGSYDNQQTAVAVAIELAREGANELTQFYPGCTEVYGVILSALHNLEGHTESVGEATGDAAGDGVWTDGDVAAEYLSLPSISDPPC